MTSTKMTQTHIEHPEDTILTGDLSAITALYERDSHVSMKMVRLANLEGYGSWNSLCDNDAVAQYKNGKFNYILFDIA